MKKIHNIWFLALLLVSVACDKQEIGETDLEVIDLQAGSKSKIKSIHAKLLQKEAPFDKREGHSSVAYDHKMWVIGGYEGFGGNSRNDIWHSKDGVSWAQVLVSKHFSPRTSHTTTVFKNKLWVIGGNEIPNRKNDVWQSSDGNFWQEVTNKAGFSERSSHTAFAFDHRLWVIGGLDQNKNPKNDVWYSKNGIDWILATPNAAFSPRFEHTSFIYDDKIWVIGGRESIDPSNKLDVKNDVWYSKNGIDWVQATQNAAFSSRSGHSSVVYDDKMWVLGGSDMASNKTSDAWCSKDGAVWKQALKAEYPKRTAHSTIVFDKMMWIMAGIDDTTKNDVWALE